MGNCIFGYVPAFIILSAVPFDILPNKTAMKTKAGERGHPSSGAERFFYHLVSPD